MRALLIAVLFVVVASPNTADARRGGGIVLINTGDAITHLRDLDAEQAALVGYHKLGYRYERFGVVWLDLWRWGGEFVVYDGSTYAPLSADDLESLGGASVPWRYHLPPLLLLLLAALELFIVGRRKRTVKVGLIVGGVLVAIAALFYFKGLAWEFSIPGLLGLYHLVTSYFAMKQQAHEEVVTSEPQTSSSGAFKQTSSGSFTPSSSGSFKQTSSGSFKPMTDARDSGPIPSRPSQPIVVQRATTQPTVAPIRPDDNAEAPKLLR